MEFINVTAFELLGIENKELPISNLLSNYLNPNINFGVGYLFLNEFCKMANINPVNEKEKVFVDREFYIQNNGGKNYIDILIRVGNLENPSRIICIENKIYSSEGIEQTKRYYNALEAEFSGCINRQYIYLTKNNSSVNLTSQHFIHIRYVELGKLLVDNRFDRLPLARDFYQYYVLRELEQFQSVEDYDRDFRVEDIGDFKNLIEYIVWKINSYKIFDYSEYNCIHGKSAQSSTHFFQLFMQNWEFELNEKAMSIHLEGNSSEVYLHMELKPYEPFNSLEKSYGTEFLNKYIQKRDELRHGITFETVQDCSLVPIRKNANLQIAKFRIKASTYKSYFDTLIKLAICVNAVLVKAEIIDIQSRRPGEVCQYE